MNTVDKQILTIIGSPRKGNTYRICQAFAEKVTKIDPTISFEYLFLKNEHIKMCRGCQLCLFKGAAKCPLKDDIPQISHKLKMADSFILAAPGYNQHVPGIMKNFIDRLSFNCHSPSLYGKNALIVTTVGGVGEKPTSKYLTLIATCWGAHVAGALNVKIDYQKNVDSYKAKTEKNITRLAQTYVKALASDEKPAPNYHDLLVFASLREETRFSPHFRELWKQMGWADSDYYYDAKINPISRLFARIMGFIIKREMSAVLKDKS
ncbi:flavodoxin family protein [Desulfococcaceae bacterium HSG7]|nr:flavodoxin family protein [Desulfococcaceae bacterium HSG7]